MAERKNTSQFKEKWIENYNKGMSLTAIGKLYGVNKNTVKNQIKDSVVFREKSPNEKYIAEWLKLYNEGTTKAEISRMYSVTPGVVGRMLEKAGIPLNNEHLLQHKDKEEMMIELYTKGKTLKEVGMELGISDTVVWKYLNSAGIDRRWYSETSRIYDFDDNYFDNMDKIKSFIFGLMYKTSFLYKASHGNCVRIILSCKKSDIMTKIHDELKLTKKLYVDEIDNCYRVEIHSTKLCDNLENLGLRLVSEEYREPKLSIKNYENFINGYIYTNSMLKGEVYFIYPCSSFLKKDIINHLKKNIGITQICDSLEDKIFIKDKNEVLKFISYYKNLGHKYFNK